MTDVVLAIPDIVSVVWDNHHVFVVVMSLAIGMLGFASKSLALASWGSLLTFSYFALEAGIQWMENVLMVVLMLILIGFAFKLWRFEGVEGI